MKFEITREYWFSAAHRLEGHPKCGRLHGHNYRVVVCLRQPEVLGPHYWVMDYGEMDARIKPVIETLDHRYLISRENIEENCPYAAIAVPRGEGVVLPMVARTTGEELAAYLQFVLRGVLDIGHREVAWVRVDEGPKSTAVFYED